MASSHESKTRGRLLAEKEHQAELRARRKKKRLLAMRRAGYEEKRAQARRHVALGWPITDSARALDLPAITVRRWRREWIGEKPASVGRTCGSFRGRNLRSSKKQYPELHAKARNLITEMNLPEPLVQLIRRRPGRVECARAIVAHAKAAGLNLIDVRPLLDLLKTAGSPYPPARVPRRYQNVQDDGDRTAFDIARDGGIEDRHDVAGLSKRRFRR
jgi:hypothetical protein